MHVSLPNIISYLKNKKKLSIKQFQTTWAIPVVYTNGKWPNACYFYNFTVRSLFLAKYTHGGLGHFHSGVSVVMSYILTQKGFAHIGSQVCVESSLCTL